MAKYGLEWIELRRIGNGGELSSLSPKRTREIKKMKTHIHVKMSIQFYEATGDKLGFTTELQNFLRQLCSSNNQWCS